MEPGSPATSTDCVRDFVMANHAIVHSERRSERSGERRLRFARGAVRRGAPRTSASLRAPGNRESLADASEHARAIAATICGGIANRIGGT
jgi:hypothetical protein